jgi:hypothetical protein
MIKLNLKPERNVLEQFSWIALFAFPLLGGLFTRGGALWYDLPNWNWSHTAVSVLLGIAVVQRLALFAGIRHLTLGLYVVMTLVAFPIGFVLSHVIMLVIYYLVITPIALVFRVMGRDVLGRRLEPQRTSYWTERSKPRDAASYFKLY